MEHVLRQVRYHVPNRLAARGGANPVGMALPATSSLSGTLGSAPLVKTPQVRSYSRPVLPPIASKKKQVRPQQRRISGDRVRAEAGRRKMTRDTQEGSKNIKQRSIHMNESEY